MSIRERIETLIDTATRSASPAPERSSHRARLKAILGIVALGVVVFFFILRARATAEDLVSHWQSLNIVNVAASLALVFVAFVLASGLWWGLIRLLGGQIGWREALHAYFISSLPRYIPGSIWGYVGRTYLIEQLGVCRVVAVFSTLIEIGLFVGSGLAVGIAFRFNSPAASVLAILIGFALVVGLSIAPLIINRGKRFQLQFLCASMGITFAYFMFWLIYGLSIVIIVQAFASDFRISDAIGIISGFAIAWLAGFFAIFVPGGLGVREAGIVLTLEPITGSVTAVFIAILSRLINLLVDAVFFSAALLLRRFMLNIKGQNTDQYRYRLK